jgi:hypothetical protein
LFWIASDAPSPALEMSDHDLAEKFVRNTTCMVAEGRNRDVVSALLSLPELSDVTESARLLAPK